jgi:hypothetical protein
MLKQWLSGKKLPTQCVCHIIDPREDAPITVVRPISNDSEKDVLRHEYDRFNDNGQMYVVLMAAKDSHPKMEAWYVSKADALEWAEIYYDRKDPIKRMGRLTALPVDNAEKNRAIDDFMKGWIHYNSLITWKPGVTLAQIISGFAIPMRIRFDNEYYNLRAWGDWMFWSVMQQAIEREGRFTHGEVAAAVKEAESQ